MFIILTVTVNLRMLNKPIISLQPFQQKKSCSDDCFFWQSVVTESMGLAREHRNEICFSNSSRYQSLFRCRIATLNFSMGFLHVLHHWSVRCGKQNSGFIRQIILCLGAVSSLNRYYGDSYLGLYEKLFPDRLGTSLCTTLTIF